MVHPLKRCSTFNVIVRFISFRNSPIVHLIGLSLSFFALNHTKIDGFLLISIRYRFADFIKILSQISEKYSPFHEPIRELVLLSYSISGNALIIALLCAVFNIVPYVGPIIATFVAGILIMISSIGTGADFASETLPTTIYVLIGMFIVQLIDNNVSSPLIFSKSTNSHPLEIFLVILIAGILFGITGMIIAVPFYTSLKVIGKEFLPENKIIKALTKNL